MSIGHRLEADTAIGPLMSARHLKRLAGYVDSGKAAGVEVVFGGEVVQREGYFYRPTALLDASPETTVMQEEIFWPVVNIVPFDDMSAVIAAAHDST